MESLTVLETTAAAVEPPAFRFPHRDRAGAVERREKRVVAETQEGRSNGSSSLGGWRRGVADTTM